jgi:hypothetical protein
MVPGLVRRFRSALTHPQFYWPAILLVGARMALVAQAFWLWNLGRVPTTPDVELRPYYGVTPVVEGIPAVLFGVWQRFDAIHYLRIASHGYSAPDLPVFPPLYPLLVRVAGIFFGGDYLLGALVVSSVASFLLISLFMKIVAEEGYQDLTKRSAAYLFFFPTAFFLLAPYTESLFLLLALATFRETRRGRWAYASLAGLAAALTRLQGVLLTLVIATEMLRRRKWSLRQVGLPIVSALTPVLGYGFLTAWRLASGFSGITYLQSRYWHRVPTGPWVGILKTVDRICDGTALPIEHLDLGIVLMMLLIGVLVVRRLPAVYGVYFWSMMIFNLLQVRIGQPLSGQARFSVVLFPAFIVLAQLGGRAWVNRLVFYPSFLLWSFLAGQFMMWGWVG